MRIVERIYIKLHLTFIYYHWSSRRDLNFPFREIIFGRKILTYFSLEKAIPYFLTRTSEGGEFWFNRELFQENFNQAYHLNIVSNLKSSLNLVRNRVYQKIGIQIVLYRITYFKVEPLITSKNQDFLFPKDT